MTASPQAIITDIAHYYGVTLEDMRARTRQPTVDRARSKAYKALREQCGWSYGRIGQFFGRSRPTVLSGVKAADQDDDAEETARLLRQRLNYLSGHGLVYNIASALDVKPEHGIMLAILIRGAPKPVPVGVITELYDHAWQAINGREHYVCESSIRSAVSRLRKHITQIGLPMPIVTVPPSAYALTSDFGLWVQMNITGP